METDNQLVEFKNVAQIEKGVRRRVFVNGDDDLTVWYDLKNTLIGFELTFNQVVITYAGNKFSVHGIDRCEKDNYIPTLMGAPDVNLNDAVEYISKHCSLVDIEITEYMKAVILKRL